MTDKTETERGELVRRLQEMRERLLSLAVKYKVGDQFDGDFQNIDDAIAALSAQQAGEPVAWMTDGGRVISAKEKVTAMKLFGADGELGLAAHAACKYHIKLGVIK